MSDRREIWNAAQTLRFDLLYANSSWVSSAQLLTELVGPTRLPYPETDPGRAALLLVAAFIERTHNDH